MPAITRRRVEVALVAVVASATASSRTSTCTGTRAWVLTQVGLIGAAGLSVARADSARNGVDRVSASG